MSNRKWYVDEALSSYSHLLKILNQMTMEEIVAALELESQSRRRRSVIDRLIGRAARLNEIEYVKQLKARYIHVR